MRIADLMPDFGTAPRHPNRPREALDASPHPNGSGPLGPLGLPTKWDGLGGAGIGIYGLSRHPAGRLREGRYSGVGQSRRGGSRGAPMGTQVPKKPNWWVLGAFGGGGEAVSSGKKAKLHSVQLKRLSCTQCNLAHIPKT